MAETEQREPEQGRRARVPRRRRVWLSIIAVFVLGAAVAGNVVLVGSVTVREPMLVLARDVPWGQHVRDADLSNVDMLPDAARYAIPASRRGEVAGKVAAGNLAAGQVLGPRDITTQQIPAAGQRVAGLRLPPGHFPARGLAPNDPVEVTTLPAKSSAVAGNASPGLVFRARVVQVSARDADGAITADVLVDEAAAALAGAAAAGEPIVMLLGPAH